MKRNMVVTWRELDGRKRKSSQDEESDCAQLSVVVSANIVGDGRIREGQKGQRLYVRCSSVELGVRKKYDE